MQTLNARSGVPFGDSVTSVSVAERGGGTRSRRVRGRRRAWWISDAVCVTSID